MLLLQKGPVPLLTSVLSHSSQPAPSPTDGLCAEPDHSSEQGATQAFTHSMGTRALMLTQKTELCFLAVAKS